MNNYYNKQPIPCTYPIVDNLTNPTTLTNQVNPYGSDLIVNEIVRDIINTRSLNVKNLINTIFGTIIVKYAVDNASKFIVNILNFPLQVLNTLLQHIPKLKIYIKYLLFGLIGKYKVYKFSLFNYNENNSLTPKLWMGTDNKLYNLYNTNEYINFNNDEFSLHFGSIVYIISSNEIKTNNNLKILCQDKYLVNLITNGNNFITTKYVFELDVYKKLGNMIKEFIFLNEKLQKKGCCLTFCFYGYSGCGKTQFCYYVEKLKLCDKIIRVNLINNYLGNNSLFSTIIGECYYLCEHTTTNVIFIEELDRYFDNLLEEKESIQNIIKDDKNSKHAIKLVNDTRKINKQHKINDFIKTLHLIADSELLPNNNIVIINSNNLESIYKKLVENGIKQTVINSLRSRIQVIKFEYPTYKDICDVCFDIFTRCEKKITYEQVKEIVPKDINMSFRDLDAKIVISGGNEDKLKELLNQKIEDIIIYEPIKDDDSIGHIINNDEKNNDEKYDDEKDNIVDEKYDENDNPVYYEGIERYSPPTVCTEGNLSMKLRSSYNNVPRFKTIEREVGVPTMQMINGQYTTIMVKQIIQEQVPI